MCAACVACRPWPIDQCRLSTNGMVERQERSHRDSHAGIACELQDLGLESSDWIDVLDSVVDKLNRRSRSNGKPSPHELLFSTPPFFSAVEFLRSVGASLDGAVRCSEPNERVWFFHPHKVRNKLEHRYDPYIVVNRFSPLVYQVRPVEPRACDFKCAAHFKPVVSSSDVPVLDA